MALLEVPPEDLWLRSFSLQSYMISFYLIWRRRVVLLVNKKTYYDSLFIEISGRKEEPASFFHRQ
jgi:hypothetical protein